MPFERADLPMREIVAFCRRWRIAEMALFGSALQDTFAQESDLDFLVAFEPDADWGLLEHVQMRDELAALVNRRVDLVTRRSVEASPNWIRREAILRSAERVYAA
ncbi:MAG: nucleotidyltransferase domain-containing protein [Phycisphaerales bacterium]|nr:nucleotidyltransferase domain-containing protein [Phycisphaerales bacterium]